MKGFYAYIHILPDGAVIDPPDFPNGDIGDPVDLGNSNQAMTVYAWERDPSVTFESISQTVRVDPRPYGDTVAEAQRAADDYTAQIQTLQSAGFKAAFRYWFEHWIEPVPVFSGNWWERQSVFVPPVPDAVTTDWWAAFNARVVANGITPDFKIHDFEIGMNYFQLPDEATRRTFFEPVTIDSPSNPYPFSPNPFIGSEIWRFNDPKTDQFIQIYNQWAAERKTEILQSFTDACPVADNYYSNWEDYIQSFEVGNRRERNERLPAAQTRLSDVTSVNAYLDYGENLSLTDPEDTFISPRSQINRRRWKNFIWRFNRSKSAATADAIPFINSRVVPWIAPPGYGANGSNTWASSAILPFEKLLWRMKMRHLRAIGLDTFILWNPVSNNPNSADTDKFMDEYFKNTTVRSDMNNLLGPTPMDADSIVTNDRVTQYRDIYAIRFLYTQRATAPIEPFSQGFGTSTEPLIINAGATGDAERQAFIDALEIVYGTQEGDPFAFVVPDVFEVTGIEPVPE